VRDDGEQAEDDKAGDNVEVRTTAIRQTTRSPTTPQAGEIDEAACPPPTTPPVPATMTSAAK